VHLRTGTIAVVTGGGSGIGLAVAHALAARGFRLALIDIRADRLESARSALAAAGPAVSVHTADVCDEDALSRVAAEVRRQHGPAALLINSAGVSLAGPFADTEPGAFDWVMRVNFGGTVRCCRVFLPQLRQAGAGHIVMIGSCFGWVGFPGKAGYCASKFAVRGFSEALRAELHPEGIGVTVVYPGPVDTNLVRDGRATDDRARQEEAEFLVRRGIPADWVARQVIRAVERNVARVVVGLDYRAIDLLVRLAPSWALALIGRFSRRFPGAVRSAEPSAASDPTHKR
jgi:short-subunit dehydrogenase